MNTTPVRFVHPRRRRRGEHGLIWLQMALGLFFGAILFFVVLFVLSGGYQLLYLGRVFPGVSVAGVNLSGLSQADASARLSAELTYPYGGRILFRDGSRTWVATPAQLGMVIDPDATAKLAYQVGRSGNLFQNVYDQLNAAQVGEVVSPVSVFDQRQAYAYLQQLAAQIDQPAVDASLSVDGLTVSAEPGQMGRTLNVESTLVYVNAQMQSFRDGEIPLVIQQQAPTIMDASAEAEQARHLLSASFVLSIPNAQQDDPGPWAIDPKDLAGMLRVSRVSGDSGSKYALQVDPQKFQPILDALAKQINRDKADARFTFDDTTQQLDLLQPSVVGLTLDEDATLQAVETAVAQGQQSAELSVTHNEPQVASDATAQKLGILQLVSEQTTYFYGSPAARLQNIQTAAARFNGLLVPPNSTFSMGQYIGDISLDNGYAEALIIYGGQTITGVGGGVCQVSTTLFRAALFGGYPIVERHSHAYRVHYYEQTSTGADNPLLAGIDATVYFPLVDFKFNNDRPYWLLMETVFDAQHYSLTWKFYSTDDGRTVKIDASGPQNIVPAPKPVVEENSDFSTGEIQQVDWAADGADVLVKRTVMRGNTLMFSDQFSTHYEPWAAVCQYGPGTKDPEKTLKKRNLCQSPG